MWVHSHRAYIERACGKFIGSIGEAPTHLNPILRVQMILWTGRLDMDSGEIVRKATEAGVQLVFFLYCDNGGIIRGKSTHVSSLAKRLETGIGLTMAMQAMSDMDRLQPVARMGPVGEIRLVPDLDTPFR